MAIEKPAAANHVTGATAKIHGYLRADADHDPARLWLYQQVDGAITGVFDV